MRVFVVWEPILLTDLQPPSNRELARVSDRRAEQFWDKDRLVSKAISPLIVGNSLRNNQQIRGQSYRIKGETLWDTVAIYRSNLQWGENGPFPAYSGGPVVDVASELRKALRDAIDHPMLIE